MSRAPISLRSVLAVLAVGAALVAPGVARAALPSFTYSPSAPLTAEVVTFVSTISEGTHSWDLDEDGACGEANGPTAQRAFDSAGTYTVKMCVTDGSTNLAVTREITVLNRPPIAAFTFAPVAPLTGDQIVLTSASVDPDGPIAGLAWDLDNDGAFDDGTGASSSLSFPAAGAYTVRLLAVDRDGAASLAVQVITVRKRPPELLAALAVVRVVLRVTGRGAKIRELIVKAPTGSKVEVRCRGRGCPFRRLTRTAASRTRSLPVRASRLVRIRRFRHRTLRPGTVVQVWVTKPEAIGKYTRFRIRRGKRPKRADRCVMPGASRPARCPSF